MHLGDGLRGRVSTPALRFEAASTCDAFAQKWSCSSGMGRHVHAPFFHRGRATQPTSTLPALADPGPGSPTARRIHKISRGLPDSARGHGGPRLPGRSAGPRLRQVARAGPSGLPVRLIILLLLLVFILLVRPVEGVQQVAEVRLDARGQVVLKQGGAAGDQMLQ